MNQAPTNQKNTDGEVPDFTFNLGAGFAKKREHVGMMACTDFHIGWLGSIRARQRGPNAGDNAYLDKDGTSVNSWGIHSENFEYYQEHLPEMVEIMRNAGKQLGVSIQPEEPGDIKKLTKLCVDCGVKLIKLNSGCNNCWKGQVQELPLGYDPLSLRIAIEEMLGVWGSTVGARVKLAAQTPKIPDALARALDIPGLTLVASNTLGGAYMMRRENKKPGIAFGKHLGGLGGKALKCISLGMLAQLAEMLPDNPRVGQGGISDGWDLYEYSQFTHEVGIVTKWYFDPDPRLPSKITVDAAQYFTNEP